MKHLIYSNGAVIDLMDAVEGEQLSVGVGASCFTGSLEDCKYKVKELGLSFEGFDLEIEPIPICTPRQIRLWLLSLGVTEEMIIAKINQIPDSAARAATLIEFHHASEFRRDHPFVESIGSSLGLNLQQIDAGFRIAATISEI